MENTTQQRLRERYGPWAVVTGASSGIGRALAKRLAEAELHLVLVARRRPILENLAATWRSQHGIEVRVVDADLSLDEGRGKIRSETADLDVGLLVASAGFGTSGPFLEPVLDAEVEMLMVNCRAVLDVCHHFGPRFAKRGRGGIVLLSSIVAYQGVPFAAHYAATKAYVHTLGEGLNVELRAHGVDVLCAAPGPTHSGFAGRAGQRMGKALDPEDIAMPILDALGRRSTVLPGLLTRLLTLSLAPLPRWARVRIMGRVMYGMTKHRSDVSPI